MSGCVAVCPLWWKHGSLLEWSLIFGIYSTNTDATWILWRWMHVRISIAQVFIFVHCSKRCKFSVHWILKENNHFNLSGNWFFFYVKQDLVTFRLKREVTVDLTFHTAALLLKSRVRPHSVWNELAQSDWKKSVLAFKVFPNCPLACSV